MMYASLHCRDNAETRFAVQWKRNHGGEPVGSQDYISVQVGTDEGQVTLYLSPKQVDDMADRLRAVAYDRCVVLAEESNAKGPLELAGGG